MKALSVVVTGAGSGIGRALAHHLADLGHDVTAVGRRVAPLEETRAGREARISIVSADVSMPEGRRKLVRALPPGRRLDLLVHNAAVLAPVTPMSRMILADWRTHMAVNVEGPLFLTQALLDHMGAGSRVLHISSGAAHSAYQGWGAYCTSKAALHMVYRVLDAELAPRGVRVGSVRPGVVDTPMQDQVRSASPEVFPELPRFEALKTDQHLADPAEVARFLAWLLLDVDAARFAEAEWDIRDTEMHGNAYRNS